MPVSSARYSTPFECKPPRCGPVPARSTRRGKRRGEITRAVEPSHGALAQSQDLTGRKATLLGTLRRIGQASVVRESMLDGYSLHPAVCTPAGEGRAGATRGATFDLAMIRENPGERSMRLVIEAEDFKRLSADTQHELLRRFAGDAWVEKHDVANRQGEEPEGLAELSPELAGRLVDGLCAEDRRRLQTFAERGGRVELGELLAVGGDERGVEEFEARMRRKLRGLGDGVACAPLFTIERASGEHVLRTSEVTARSLRCCFPLL